MVVTTRDSVSGNLHMKTNSIAHSLRTLAAELVDGAPASGAYMLNRGDPGLLKSLDKLDAEAVSTKPQGGGASIAAHVEHLLYGISLMNRWAAGENPWEDADWAAAWRRTSVTDAEWKKLRERIALETHRWLDAVGKPREVEEIDLNGIIGSIAHLAYHLGAIRQIDRAAKGPAAT